MASILPDFEYDIFISYRHNDNRSGWVAEFVQDLREEIATVLKDPVSVYFDTNAHDGLNENHDVDLSLKEKLNCLIFIPIVSQTYCDLKSFAWKNEFVPFRELATNDRLGLKMKVANGNVASRILPARIHDLCNEDLNTLEQELGGMLRAIDFTFKSTGINRPLTKNDLRHDNATNILYRDQINKVAHAIKEILDASKEGNPLHQKKENRFNGLRNTIPVPATKLFGRDKEFTELIDLVDHHPVITILGSGGMGKTRLALELSHQLKNKFSGNIVFVPLAAITSAEEVIPALANALGVKDAEGRSLMKGISTVIGDQKALLVLDNLEQVIAVAPQLAELISNCANLKMLCTSRTPLKIRAEKEYQLKPLLLPSDNNSYSIDTLTTYPSVSLFIDRSQKVNAAFQITSENASDVVQICKRLDGLPLALELAAARIRMMSAKQLLQRLEHALDILTSGAKDLPERHQTLRATIDWSHSLLTDAEKKLFRRMSTFNGGCTLNALEESCYEENSALAFEELESLVDKGLVQHVGSSDRFLLLETIKEYALEKLEAAGEVRKIKMQQARYFLKIANQVRYGLESKNQLESMHLGISEEANIQAALDFLFSEAKGGNAEAIEMGLMICGQLYFFWHIRCKHIMARQYSYAFLTLPYCPTSSRGKCLCLNTVGLALSTLGKHEQSIKEHRAAYEIAATMSDKSTMGVALLGIFVAAVAIGKIDEASNCAREYHQLTFELGVEFLIGWAHTIEGIMHSVKGELEEAKQSFHKSLDIQTSIPDLEGGGLSRGGLALISSIWGKYEEAIEWYQSALTSFVTIGDRAEEARILEEMAWVFLKIENADQARNYFLNSIHAYEDVGSVRGIGLGLLGIAGVESVEQHPSKAIAIATAAQYFTEQEGIVNNYGEGFQGKIYLDNAKSKLTKDELEKAMEKGMKLSLKETLQLANVKGN